MKTFSPILFTAIWCGLYLTACTTDFELEAGGKDIPIAYGFIDLKDTAHYIRIERAFLSGTEDAAVVARRIDSIYYDPSVSVWLVLVETGQQFQLQRVDGNGEGYPRQTGAFAEAPNILYKIRADVLNLQGGESLQLHIDRGTDFPLVTAETAVLSPVELVNNLPPDPFSLGNYLSTRRIAWRTEPPARIFHLQIGINYRERDIAEPSIWHNKRLQWILSPALVREDNNIQVNYSFQVEEFFQFIGVSLEPLPAGRREFTDIDIAVTGGGKEFETLTNIAQANVGITSGSDVIPVFTNLSEGRGIFTSRTGDRRTGIQLTAPSLDSLRNGIYTRDLGF